MKIDLKFIPYTQREAANLQQLFVGNEWPFHFPKIETPESFQSRINRKQFEGKEKKTFLIKNKNSLIGYVKIFDLGEDKLNDEIPLFDIRIAATARGKGIGKQAVQFLSDWVFNNYPNKYKIEATTRIDNIAMRKVLKACNFIKEAHYRNGWETATKRVAAIGYGLLKTDWQNNTITPINWQEDNLI